MGKSKTARRGKPTEDPTAVTHEPVEVLRPRVQLVASAVDLAEDRLADAGLTGADRGLDVLPHRREDVAWVPLHQPDEDVGVEGIAHSAPPVR